MSQRFTQAHRFGSEGHSDRSDFQLRNPAHPSASHSAPSTGSNMQHESVKITERGQDPNFRIAFMLQFTL